MYGVGRLPHAPATWGTVFFLPVVFLLALYTNPLIYMVFTILFIILSICSAQAYAQGVDSKEIVIDEASGILVAMFLVPFNWKLWVIGFIVFRFFDILKPFPISHLDKNIKGGFGVVLDDLVAGLATNALMHFLIIDFMVKGL